VPSGIDKNTSRSERESERSRLAGHIECFHNYTLCCRRHISHMEADPRVKARVHPMRSYAIASTYRAGVRDSLPIQSMQTADVRLTFTYA
jgi:hypothetical protein